MKKVLYVILGLVVLYVVLALFGPKQVKVERQVSINKPAQAVKEKLTDFKFFHDKWNPWAELDPAMKTTFEGTAGQIGHYYSWTGNKDVGSGKMELVGFNGDTVINKLSFEGQGDSKTYYIVKDNNASSDVTWGMTFDVGFMGRPIMLFMNMDKMLGEYYEKGLSKLKTEVESMPDATSKKNYEINEQNWEASTYVGKKEAGLTFDKIGAFFGKNYPALFGELEKNKVAPQSAPSGIYSMYNEKEQKADVAAVVKVPPGTKIKGWDVFSYPASKVLHLAYYGAYEKSGDAHMAMDAYMKEKNLQQVAVIEEYVTDPSKEKDTTKWMTNIFYVVK
jgi:effector-binding domain-containing protein